MKKNKFLVLVSLCSVFAGMPTKACEIKDSTGGQGVPLTSRNLKPYKKSEQDSKLLEYLFGTVFGLNAIGGTHEGLAYFYGNEGQFYEKPSKYSFVEMCCGGSDDKIKNKDNNPNKTGIDQTTKKLISDFRYYASYTLESNKIVEELKKVFSEQEVNKLKEISEVKKQKMFGYDKYELDYHPFSSYHLKKIPEGVLGSLVSSLGCKYSYYAYKEKLEFFVARNSYDTTAFLLFCCPKSDQDLCKKLENKFFQRQEKTPVLNPHINDEDSDEKFKKWCEGAYLDAQDAYNAQNEILKKYNNIELFENCFMEELLKKNKNLDIVGEFTHWGVSYISTEIGYMYKNLIKFGVN